MKIDFHNFTSYGKYIYNEYTNISENISLAKISMSITKT